jgi:hypothetical protein
MLTRIGYFESIAIKPDNVYEAYNEMPIYKDNTPKSTVEDCYRVTIIDGALFIEKWEKNRKSFYPIVLTNHFTIRF